MKTFLSVKQAVAALNHSVSAKLLYKLISQGKLRVNRATGKVLIEQDSLFELMATPEEPASEPPPPVRKAGRPKKAAALDLW